MAAPRARPEPLLVRAGARFTCVATGLCCTDLHALGPLRRGDITRLRSRRDDAVARHERLAATTIAKDAAGRCVFLAEGRCGLHGTPDKPSLCRRFPFGAVATPAGLRITTSHRCPCRTLGDRAPIDRAEAARALRSGRGPIAPHAHVGERVALTSRTSASFARYAAAEADLIARLVAGEPLFDVLGIPAAWPALEGLTWNQVGHTLRSVDALGTGFDLALAWFGHGLLVLLDEEASPPARPWASTFDRAELFPGTERLPLEIIGDFAADALWDLRWAERSSFDRLATDLAVRCAVADALTHALIAEGARADRAAAEAVLVVELAGESMPYRQALARAAPLPVRLPGVDHGSASRR